MAYRQQAFFDGFSLLIHVGPHYCHRVRIVLAEEKRYR